MPLKIAKGYSKELDMVLSIFDKTRPSELPHLEIVKQIEIVKQKEKELSTATAVAVDAADVIAEAAPAGFLKTGLKLAGLFIKRGAREISSVTYTDLNYVHEEMKYSIDEAKTQALIKRIHDALYHYSGKKTYDDILTDHRTLIVVLLEYLNKGIATHPDKHQLYIKHMTDFIAEIFANEKKAQREQTKHAQVFLLDSKSSDVFRLENTLNRIGDDFLYPYIDGAKKASVSDRLAKAIRESVPTLKQSLEEFDHKFLTLMTGFSQIPGDFIQLVVRDDATVNGDRKYSDILKTSCYKHFIEPFFVMPNYIQNWLTQFHQADSASRLRISTRINEDAGEVNPDKIQQQLTSVGAFPYYSSFNEEAAKRIAAVLTARNKLLKISFYLDKLLNLMDKGGVLALIFSKRTIKILLQAYRNTLEEFGSAQKKFYDLCQQIYQRAVKEGQTRGVLGWAQDRLVQPGNLKEWIRCHLQTNRLADEKKIEELADLANKTTLNLSQVSKEEIAKEITDVLDVIKEGLTEVLALEEEFVAPKPTVAINADTIANPDEDLESSLHFVVVRDAWKDEAQENYIQQLQAEASNLYKSLDEASQSVARAEQKCEELQGDLEHLEQVLNFYLTGKPPEKGFRSGESLHEVQNKALQQQKAIYDKRMAAIKQRYTKQEDLFIQYKLPDAVRRKINELSKANSYEDDGAIQGKPGSKTQSFNLVDGVELIGRSYQTLQILKQSFDYFIEQYQDNINQGKGGFFHARHGDSGRLAANQQIIAWNRITSNIVENVFANIQALSEKEIAERFKYAISELCALAKTRLQQQSTGNLYRHSLKTYLIAYCEMLEMKYEDIDKQTYTLQGLYDDIFAEESDPKAKIFTRYFTGVVGEKDKIVPNTLSDADFRKQEYIKLTGLKP